MVLLVKVIGIVIAGIGFMSVMNPALIRRMLKFWRAGRRIYAGGIVRIVFGAVFLFAASRSGIPAVLYTIGILSFTGGVLIFVWKLEKAKAMLDWWDKRPDTVLRVIALFALLIGALIVSSA